jgi:drug/metabolite transporter (DMT)-like permease
MGWGSHRARAALLVPVVLWAVAFPAIRVGVAGYGPAALSVLRLAVASAVLGLVAPLLGVRRPSWGDMPLIVLSGVTGMAGYQLLLNWGEVHVAAGTASLIVATNPIYSAVIAVAILGERLHPRQVIGAVVALVGTAAIATAQGSLRVERSAVVVLAAAIAFGVYHTAIKPLLGRYSGLEVTAYATWAATLLLAPAIPTLVHALPHAGAGATLAAVFLGLGPSALGFVSWGYAVARLPVTVATGSLYLAPPIAVLVGYVWLGETPRLVELLGGAVAIAGVAIANSRPQPTAEPTQSPAVPIRRASRTL